MLDHWTLESWRRRPNFTSKRQKMLNEATNRRVLKDRNNRKHRGEWEKCLVSSAFSIWLLDCRILNFAFFFKFSFYIFVFLRTLHKSGNYYAPEDKFDIFYFVWALFSEMVRVGLIFGNGQCEKQKLSTLKCHNCNYVLLLGKIFATLQRPLHVP
jgi:hypothetical protein